MTRHRRMPVVTLAAAVGLLASGTVFAHGDVRCNAGPRASWKPIEQVKKQASLEGWTLQKAQIEGDCYEVYARTEDGQVVEAFFHPVTLKKLIVYRRGQEIFRAPGFDPKQPAAAEQRGD